MIRAMQRMYGADCCQNKKAEIIVFRQKAENKAEKSLPTESRKRRK